MDGQGRARGRARGRSRGQQAPPAGQPSSLPKSTPTSSTGTSSSSVPAVGRSAARGGGPGAPDLVHQMQQVSLQGKYYVLMIIFCVSAMHSTDKSL